MKFADSKTPVQVFPLSPNGQVRFWSDLLAEGVAAEAFAALETGLDWRQLPVRMFGRSILQPRLTAYYGDPGSDYRYSGLSLVPQAWPRTLAALRDLVAAATGARWNCVLCNLYRDGRDYMGWHADNEPELGPEPLIASLSLGATRRFVFKPRSGDGERRSFELTSGSLLEMSGEVQRYWLHQLPRALRVRQPRINLTFRYIDSPPGTNGCSESA